MSASINRRSPRGRSRRRLLLALLVLFLFGGIYVVLAGSVSKELTDRDQKAIATLNASQPCAQLDSFDRQVACVRFVQRSIQTRVPDMRCAENGEPIEPLDFLERGYGCCFDRARFMAKALERYGLKTRHVSLHDRSDYGPLAYAMPGVRSHASTEVYTSRGWMGVDSNEPFLLLTREGKPVTYTQLRSMPRDQLLYQPAPGDFFDRPLLITYGLYSRHGRFHGPDLPAPEINYPEFLRYNFRGEDRPPPQKRKNL